MKRPANYQTKQREAILSYIVSLGGSHVTASRIVEHFKDHALPISRTTVYRHLDRLEESGKLRKYTLDGTSGACYQYAEQSHSCQEHFHLKCEDCGELLHLQCNTLEDIGRHVFEDHAFQVNPMKTVLYGKCRKCLHRIGSLLLVLLVFLLSFLGLPSAAVVGNASGGNTSTVNMAIYSTSDSRIHVVCTIFALYDFAREIAGEKAHVTMLLPPASESHSFEPTPHDMIRIQDCDLFIYVGGESDAWIERLLSSMDTGSIRTVTLMDCVEALEEELVEGMQSDESDYDHKDCDHEDHDHEDHVDHNHADDDHSAYEITETATPDYDEHIWTSPRNTKRIVLKITAALCEADTDNTGFYQANANAYLIKLDELDTAFQEAVKNSTRKTLVFGDRFPFRYFTDAYGLAYFAAFPGCAAQSEPSAQTVAFLIDKVAAESIPVVLTIELSNQNMAKIIGEATGAKILELHSCHNIKKDDFVNGVTYLDLMTRNVDVLKEALQ